MCLGQADLRSSGYARARVSGSVPIRYHRDAPDAHKKFFTTETRRSRSNADEFLLLRVLRVLYVQNHSKTFYYLPPCPRGEERSDEPCGHGERPTTDRAPASHGRH